MTANDIAQAIMTAIQAKNWQYVAILGVVAVTAGIRYIAPRLHGKFGAWVNSNRGGSVLVTVTGVAMALMTAAKLGQHITMQMVISGLVTAASASGLWNIFWDVLKPSDGAASLGTAIVNKIAPTIPPSDGPAPPTGTNPPGVAILLPIAFLTLFSSCATMKAVGQGAAQCALDNLPATTTAVVPSVMNILESGASQASINSALEGITGIAASDLICAVEKAISILTAQIPAAEKAQPEPKVERGIVAGQSFLKTTSK